jgi:hypothetical protein
MARQAHQIDLHQRLTAHLKEIVWEPRWLCIFHEKCGSTGQTNKRFEIAPPAGRGADHVFLVWRAASRAHTVCGLFGDD